MKTFTVTLVETTVKKKYIEVQANDWEEAEDLAQGEYYKGIEEWDYEDDNLEMIAEEEEQEPKLFNVRWGSGYIHPDNRTVDMAEFVHANGWDELSIEKVEDLQVGQVADCSDMSGDVYVERIK